MPILNFNLPEITWRVILPELIVSIFALIILVKDFLSSEKEPKHKLGYLGIVGLVLAMIVSLTNWGVNLTSFEGTYITDNFSTFLDLVFLLVAVLTILISINYLKLEEIETGEYYALILFSTVGMMTMASGMDLIVIFLGLELLSIPLYVLAGLLRKQAKSSESALKYLLLGAFASAFLLYGIALTYGAVGSTKITDISKILTSQGFSATPMLMTGLALMLVGFGFKIASVPFHVWTPDVYEGAPTSVTAFMSAGPKVAGFAAILRILLVAYPAMHSKWATILWLMAALTMTVGNITALTQHNIKRMLAYSSIAHAGYLLVAVTAGNETGFASVFYYLLVYILMNLGAFAVIVALAQKADQDYNINDYAGLGYKFPFLGFCLAVFMFSLAGIPPTAGFIGKFYIFSAAIKAKLIWLALIGVLNSLISVFYYLRIVIIMYMREPEKELIYQSLNPALKTALIITLAGVFILGILPASFLKLAIHSVIGF